MVMILDKTKLDVSLDVCRKRGPQMGAPTVTAPKKPGEAKQVVTQVATSRFGLMEVDPDLVLIFPDGLIGFERCRRYIVVRHQDNSAFRWLQSLEEPAIAFPIVEPGEFCTHYAPTISDSDARNLQLDRDTPTLLFTIITVPPSNPRSMTANLLAPLVINGVTRKGKQVIVQDEGYTTRHKIMDEMASRQKPG